MPSGRLQLTISIHLEMRFNCFLLSFLFLAGLDSKISREIFPPTNKSRGLFKTKNSDIFLCFEKKLSKRSKSEEE